MVINIPSKLTWMNCCLMQSLYRFDAAYHTTVRSIVLQLNELITYHVKSTYSQDSLDSINVLQSVHKSHTHFRGEWKNSHLSNKVHSLIFSRIGCRWPQAKYRHTDRGRCNSWRKQTIGMTNKKKKYSQHSRKVAMIIPSKQRTVRESVSCTIFDASKVFSLWWFQSQNCEKKISKSMHTSYYTTV